MKIFDLQRNNITYTGERQMCHLYFPFSIHHSSFIIYN